MVRYPPALLNLIAYLKKLPGVGSKTAERFAFQLLNWQEPELATFANHLSTLKEKIHNCPECHSLMEQTCMFCTRDSPLLCIVSSPKDIFAIEETRSYRGLYHVIKGLLSPLNGRYPEHLQLDQLKKRIAARSIKEVIIALDATIEGDATALYLKEQLQDVHVSRLAFGLPMGSSLDFVDGSTLSRALTGRHSF